MAKFQKGHKKLGGRQKGTSNKLTLQALRAQVVEAANAAHPLGGVAYLTHCAKRHPTAFMALMSRLIRQEVDVGLDVVHTIRDYTGQGPHLQLLKRAPNGELLVETTE